MTRSLPRRLGVNFLKLIAVLLFLFALVLAGFYWQAHRRETQSATDYAPRSGRFVHAADVQMFIQEAGPETGPLVLLMHGTGAWSETWRETMTMLAAEGFRAVAIDMPPFGYSQRPAQPNYSKSHQAKRIIGVLDALNVEKAILLGHSFGGGPTVEAALLAPERVKALLLVDAALSIAEDNATPNSSPPAMRMLLAVKPLRNGVVATFLTNPLFTRRLLQAFIADPVHATNAKVALYQKPLSVLGSTNAVSNWLPELIAPPAASLSENPTAYRGLRMPVVAIWGARDTITPLAQGERLVALVPNAKMEVMPESGHIPQIENPKEFNQRLLTVLRELTLTPSAVASSTRANHSVR